MTRWVFPSPSVVMMGSILWLVGDGRQGLALRCGPVGKANSVVEMSGLTG